MLGKPELGEDFLSSGIGQLIDAFNDDAKGLFLRFRISKIILFYLFRTDIKPVLKEPPDFLFIDLYFLIDAKGDLSIENDLL